MIKSSIRRVVSFLSSSFKRKRANLQPQCPDFVVSIFTNENEVSNYCGTGVVVAPNYILTCGHVIHSGDMDYSFDLYVINKEERISAEICAENENYDLALLKLEKPLKCESAGFIINLTTAFRKILGRCRWGVFGFPASQPTKCTYFNPMWEMPALQYEKQTNKEKELENKSSIVETDLQREKLRTIQVRGGIDHGCSGGPAVVRTYGRSLLPTMITFGIVRLGGERAATSQICAADIIIPFLESNQITPSTVTQQFILWRSFIHRLLAAIFFSGILIIMGQWVLTPHFSYGVVEKINSTTNEMIIEAERTHFNCGIVEKIDRPIIAETTEYRPKMISIPAGEFQMGSTQNDPFREWDETPHFVKITKPFAMSQTEITQGQYLKVMGEDPIRGNFSMLKNKCEIGGVGDDMPVFCVSWGDAVRFCNRLSQLESLKPAYRIEKNTFHWDRTANGYRLPTSAEWEYAARAGSPISTIYVNGDRICDLNASAWYKDTSGLNGSRRVGLEKFPNSWGLYDMAGNVWEWVWDVYEPYTLNPQIDPGKSVIDDSELRLWRGGSWYSPAQHTRVAYRYRTELKNERNADLGFRIVRNIQ